MAKKDIVHCKFCGGEIDRSKDTDWCQVNQRRYAHIKCYSDREKVLNKELETPSDENTSFTSNIWLDELYNLLKYDLKVVPNFILIKSQFNNFQNSPSKQMTAKGIYFAIKYFYEIKHNDWGKSKGGIGIVPYIYDESKEYWNTQKIELEKIIQGLEEQKKARDNATLLIIKKDITMSKNKKTKVKSLEELDTEE